MQDKFNFFSTQLACKRVHLGQIQRFFKRKLNIGKMIVSEFCAFGSIGVAYQYVKINETFYEMIALDLLVLIKIGRID